MFRFSMPDYLRFPLVLVIVTGLSAFALAMLHGLTAPATERMRAAETERSLKIVMPQAVSFEMRQTTIDGAPFVYRAAIGGDGSPMGYVTIGSAEGYSSRISVMVGVKPDLTIAAIRVLYQNETPGLGDKIQEVLSQKTWGTVITGTSPDESHLRPWFQIQFDGKAAPLAVTKDGGTIDAITGATISSRAVCAAVNQAVANLTRAVGTP